MQTFEFQAFEAHTNHRGNASDIYLPGDYRLNIDPVILIDLLRGLWYLDNFNKHKLQTVMKIYVCNVLVSGLFTKYISRSHYLYTLYCD